MKTLMLCPPRFYGVEYEINPWMDRQQQPDRSLALSQWQALQDKLQSLGAVVHLLEPQAGLPDLVFTANAGLVLGDLSIPSRFRFPERQAEEPLFKAWFARQGFKVKELEPEEHFEGEGDALFVGDRLLAGYRFRSAIGTHAKISSWLDCEVLSVELVHPHFYHLDTCFCPLDQETALIYPPAFDDYGLKVIQRLIPHLITVEEADAQAFCCNTVVLGRQLIMNRHSQKLDQQLTSLGWQVHSLEFSQFIKAGGSAKCMVLTLHEPMPKKEKGP